MSVASTLLSTSGTVFLCVGQGHARFPRSAILLARITLIRKYLNTRSFSRAQKRNMIFTPNIQLETVNPLMRSTGIAVLNFFPATELMRAGLNFGLAYKYNGIYVEASFKGLTHRRELIIDERYVSSSRSWQRTRLPSSAVHLSGGNSSLLGLKSLERNSLSGTYRLSARSY